ncbi:winged helix-turn-helix domain-containing protein [Alsobacter sp. R-9]
MPGFATGSAPCEGSRRGQPQHADDTPELRVFVGQLRRKVEAEPTSPRLVLTEPCVGYRFGA